MKNNRLEENILEDIEKTGFPLELRVSKFLQDNGYYVANNVYYVDQDEKKGREVDMRAFKNFILTQGDREFYVRHCFLIECKRRYKDKPWIIFSSPLTVYDQVQFRIHSRGVNEDENWKDQTNLGRLSMIHPFVRFKNRGRSYYEPFKTDSERESKGTQIYKSLTTSVKATIAARNNSWSAGKGSVCFYYPVVIFDGTLYEAFLSNNKIEILEVEAVMVSFYYDSPNYKDERFVVPIVTEKYLEAFCTSMDAVLNFFGEQFRENMNWFRS